MKLLILGGTNFIGPHIVEAARRRGWSITLFNRGKSRPDGLEDCESLVGDREAGDYAALESGAWDVVIDTCGYWPRAIDQAMDALSGRVTHYVFVSTVSVYESWDENGYDEDARLATTAEPDAEVVTPKNYGALKVLCEQALERWDGPVTIVRPGLVVGPGDATDRFTYWPVRIADGGRFLAPGTPEDPIQYIDARDLAEFIARLSADGIAGTFNAVTPPGSRTMGDLVEACIGASGADAEPVWIDSGFLREHDVAAWRDVPAWVPPGSPLAGIVHCSPDRGVEAGLEFTPLGQTVADILEWWEDDRGDELRTGLAREREAELIAAFESNDTQETT